MKSWQLVRLFAGTFILLSLALGVKASPLFMSKNWLWFTGFVGVNLLQSSFTRWCPLEIILANWASRQGHKVRIALRGGLAGVLLVAATDLLAARQAAREHDPVFAAATAQSRTAEAKQRQGRALWLPQITASAGTGIASNQNATEGAEFSAPGFGISRNVDFRTSIDSGSSNRWEVAAQQPIYNAERRARAHAQAQAQQLDRQAELTAVRYHAAEPLDLVYNRLTDFYLEDPRTRGPARRL